MESLAAEVRLGGIRGIADMSGIGATGTGMSLHGAAAMTAAVGGVAPRDVAVATDTKDEGDSADLLHGRHLSNPAKFTLTS